MNGEWSTRWRAPRPPPLPALTAVASLELKDPALDNALPERWSASTSSGALDAQVGITR